MAERVLGGIGPSLIDAKATGGIHAGDGFTVQERYLALLIPEWLADPDFTMFQPERAEDIDVWFGELREHHQVKNEQLTQANVRRLIGDFRERNRPLLEEGRLRGFVIAAAHVGEQLRSFVNRLAISQSRGFSNRDEPERIATLNELRAVANELGLEEHFNFIVERVRFPEGISSLKGAIDTTKMQLGWKLARHCGCRDIDEAEHVAEELLRQLHEDRTRAWSRVDLEALLHSARRAFREGPPRPAGDLVLVCHQTLKHVDEHPERSAAPALFGERREVRVELDDVALTTGHDAGDLSRVAIRIARGDGDYMRALDRADSRVLYYGFPHVPFGVLAGYVAGPHRRVGLIEHDLDTGKFEWRPDGPLVGIDAVPRQLARGTAARVRVSVSAVVREAACEAVISPDDLALDLHVSSKIIGRGIVGSELQARQYASQLRQLLDANVAGNPSIASLHLFAAVPVSVAFLVGQVLAHTSLPPCFVYNFSALATAHYHWRLSLREAVQAKPCVELFGEVHDGAA